MSPEIHIVSLILHLRPEHKDEVIKNTRLVPAAEYFIDTQTHKLVLVFEVESESALTHWFNEINNWPGVLSTQLCYHHCEANESLQEEIHYASNPA